MHVAIITAVYDGYDTLKPTLEQRGADVEWICVTDKAPAEANGWHVIVEPRPGQHPNVAAKRPKMLPWEYTTSDYSIWVDASFQIASLLFASQAIDLAKPIAQFRHPQRSCVYTEAELSLTMAKYSGLPIAEQMSRYRAHGHPQNWGLWATGIIARAHTPVVRQLGERWLRTCQEWSFQDQLSEAVHLRDLGLVPCDLPGVHMHNTWLVHQPSRRH